MKIRCIVTTIIAILCTCQRYENPFENQMNSDIHILKQGTTFLTEGSDTLNIFSSETLLVTTSVPELLDSFSVSVSNNRHFLSKTFKNPAAKHYPFRISPYDTGLQSIVIQTFRKEGTSVSKTLLFYSRNPLTQNDLLQQNLNDSISLKTTTVGDSGGVIYVWVLGHQIVRSPFATIKFLASQMDNNEKTGFLYVSDLKYSSPQVPFKFSFYDINPPSLKCVNDNFDVSSKTITTADSTFLLRIHVYDGDNQTAEKVSFNGENADYIQNNIYSKIINNVSIYSSSNPFKMIVQAMDNISFGNSITDTFFVVHDPKAVITNETFITLNKSITSPLTTTIKTLTISGTVANTANRIISLQTELDKNTLIEEDFPTGFGAWSSSINLTNDTSLFVIKAFDNTGSLLKEKAISIVYNPNHTDTIAPIVSSIQKNGSATEAFYLSTNSVLLSFEAFDYGSGISSVTIDGEDQVIAPGQSRWSRTIYNLPHSRKDIDIVVIDTKGNRTDTSTAVFYNRLPSPKFGRLLPYAVRTDSVYNAEIFVTDPDGDPVRISIIQHPLSMYFSDANKFITWNANPLDTGKDTLIYQFYDGFQNTIRYQELFIVYNPSYSKTIQLSNDQNIPAFLQAQKDTLQFTIKLSEQTGTAPYSYFARIKTLPDIFETSPTNGLVTWIPQIQDTGRHQMFIFVTDGLQQSDTLITPLHIVPPNSDTAKLQLKKATNVDTIINGTYCINLTTKTATLEIEILDTDHPLTEDHLVSVTMNGSTTRFHPDSLLFDITFSTPGLIVGDTIIVTVNDKTSPITDTLLVPISIYLESPKLVPNLSRWYKAGAFSFNQSRSSIYWKEEHSNNFFSLSTPTSKAQINNRLNGHTTIKLNASYLVQNNGGGGDWVNNPFSIYIVAKYDTKSLFHQALITSTVKDESYLTLGTTLDGEVAIFNREIIGPFPNQNFSSKSTLITKTGTWYIYSFQSQGIKFGTLGVNAGVNFQFDSISVRGVTNYSDFIIGSSAQYYPETPWTGEFAEIVMYNRYLSDLEHKSVIWHLINKFNIK